MELTRPGSRRSARLRRRCDGHHRANASGRGSASGSRSPGCPHRSAPGRGKSGGSRPKAAAARAARRAPWRPPRGSGKASPSSSGRAPLRVRRGIEPIRSLVERLDRGTSRNSYLSGRPRESPERGIGSPGPPPEEIPRHEDVSRDGGPASPRPRSGPGPPGRDRGGRASREALEPAQDGDVAFHVVNPAVRGPALRARADPLEAQRSSSLPAVRAGYELVRGQRILPRHLRLEIVTRICSRRARREGLGLVRGDTRAREGRRHLAPCRAGGARSSVASRWVSHDGDEVVGSHAPVEPRST